MTIDTYSHFLPSMGDQTVRAMEAALLEGPGCCTKALGYARASSYNAAFNLRNDTFSKWAMPYRTSDLLLVS